MARPFHIASDFSEAERAAVSRLARSVPWPQAKFVARLICTDEETWGS